MKKEANTKYIVALIKYLYIPQKIYKVQLSIQKACSRNQMLGPRKAILRRLKERDSARGEVVR